MYHNRENYSEILGRIAFDADDHSSESIENELFNLSESRIMCSWGIKFHPHELSKAMLIIYNKIPKEDKEKLKGFAKKFYKELGCDRSGRLGKHTKFNSIDDLF